MEEGYWQELQLLQNVTFLLDLPLLTGPPLLTHVPPDPLVQTYEPRPPPRLPWCLSAPPLFLSPPELDVCLLYYCPPGTKSRSNLPPPHWVPCNLISTRNEKGRFSCRDREEVLLLENFTSVWSMILTAQICTFILLKVICYYYPYRSFQRILKQTNQQ